jgi:hypothetical protein
VKREQMLKTFPNFPQPPAKFEIMRNLLFGLTILLLIASCKKDDKEHFKQIIFSGSVYDSSNHVGLANVPIKVNWFATGTGAPDMVFASATTDAQGNYSIKTTIDIRRFSDQAIEIKATVPSDFISVYDLEHPTVGASLHGYMGGIIQLPPFGMYQKANLSINLRRTLNDNFTEFYLYYNYDSNRDYWVFGGNNPTGSMTLNVNTAARAQIRVHWMKKFSSGATTTFQDSVICLPGASNSITIPY